MKYSIRYTLTTAALFLFSMVASADNTATVIKLINGASAGTTDPGKVEYSNGTITVTPAEGYYLTAEDLTVYKVVKADYAQTRTTDYDKPVSITAKDANADPSGKTEYTFTVESEKLDYEITANFHTRNNLENATVTVNGTYVYSGDAIEPEVTVTYGGTTLTLGTDYEVAYSDNIHAGENTAIVTVSGKRTYIGTKTANFSIAKAEAELAYSKESAKLTYGEEWTQPTLSNPHSLPVTYSSSNENVATIDEDGVVSIAGAGKTTISATNTDDNYEAQTASYELTVKLADSEIEWDKDTYDYVIGTSWSGPKLVNPHEFTVKYYSTNEKVATVDEKTGEVTVVGPGQCNIQASFSGNDQYDAKVVQYVLNAIEEYKIWVGKTQVTSANCKDILDDGHFFFDKTHKWLVITNTNNPNTKAQIIESRMSSLTIFINGSNKLERIWFNNEGKAENTGTLNFTTYNNIPGSVDLKTYNADGVISGFSSISIDEKYFLFLLDPEEGVYKDGKLKEKNGAVANAATIGQYLKPLAKGQMITFPPGDYSSELLNNIVIRDILNTLFQHMYDSDEDDDYYDPADGAIVINNVNTTNGMTLLLHNVEKGELIPGSDEYAVQFRGGLTFMVPEGEGKITLNVKTETGFKLMLMIGNSIPKEITQNERGDVTFDYNVDEPTYCCLYLEKADGTRIGKREKVHGKVYSIKVQPSRSTNNPLGNIEGFPDSATPEVVTGSTTGIVEIKHDVITDPNGSEGDNQWYDLQGRKIEKPVKPGIYIFNHKKMIVK